MNARGLSLSLFEKYKASFLKYKKFKEEYSVEIDTTWTDWIWEKIDKNDYEKDNTIFDNAFVGIFRAILTNEYAKINEKNNDEFSKNLEDLINNDFIEFVKYEELLANMEEILLNIGKIFQFFIHVKDINIENSKDELNTYIDLSEILNKQLIFQNKENKKDSNKLKSNVERCEFYSVCLYAIENYNKFNKENYIQWTRISRNLIPRIIIDNAEYTTIISNLFKLFNVIKESDNYLERFSKLKEEDIINIMIDNKTFNIRLREEITKARIMLIDNDSWKQLIEINDKNKFLAGETNFLLDFCGIVEKLENITLEEQKECYKEYEKYTKIKNIIFPENEDRICEQLDKSFINENEENSKDHKLLTRALLAISTWDKNTMCGLSQIERDEIDTEYGYLIKLKNSHYSFLTNSDDRDYSWRNIFKKENKTNCLYFKVLMTYMINENVKTKDEMINALNQIIEDSEVNNWKKYFIKNDNIYYLMNKNLNLIKIESSIKNKYNIFLLRGRTDNSNSLPLFFIALDEKIKKSRPAIKMNSNGYKLLEAWTTGLNFNLEKKKRINKINDEECNIYMARDKDDTINYYKNISNLDKETEKEVNKMLDEIQKEFEIKFEEDKF